jgi:hypothetical protein
VLRLSAHNPHGSQGGGNDNFEPDLKTIYRTAWRLRSIFFFDTQDERSMMRTPKAYNKGSISALRFTATAKDKSHSCSPLAVENHATSELAASVGSTGKMKWFR